MTAVITLPSSLDDLTFEVVLERLAPFATDEKIVVDARQTTFATPFGLTALLTLAQSRVVKPELLLPEDYETVAYWSATGFFRYAEELFTVRGSMPRTRPAVESDVILRVTPVTRSDELPTVMKRIQGKCGEILTNQLRLEPRDARALAVTLAEACQNVLDRSGRGAWVMMQVYRYKKHLGGRRVALIAVCAAGLTLRESLESDSGYPMTDPHGDAIALERSVVNFRSHTGIPSFEGRVDGKLSVRSGTARMAVVPTWDDDLPLREQLNPFPGVQLQLTIPERASAVA